MSNVIRVYDTEANALAGGTTGMVADTGAAGTHDTVGGVEATVYNSENAIPYFIFNRYYYRIEANEPVSEFHIDWDDGENSSDEKANIEIVKLRDPKTYCVVEHVYTQHKLFYPLFRVKSREGFISKWYTHHANTDATGRLQDLLRFPPSLTSITQGQNKFTRVSLAPNNNAEVPRFVPSNLPPVAILKTDRKRIFAGIYNKPIEVASASGSYPLLYAYSDMSSGTQPSVKLTVQTEDRHIREYTIAAGNVQTANSTTHSGTSSHLHTQFVPFGNNSSGPTKTNKALKLLRAELLDADNLADTNRIFINVLAANNTNLQSTSTKDEDRCVCILSNGNPIVDMTDPLYSANVDASESFTRASNSSIAGYAIDDDVIGDRGTRDSITSTSYQAHSSPNSSIGQVTDILTNGNFGRSTIPQLNVAYTHAAHGHVKDNDGRFFDFSRLVRAQVVDDSSDLGIAGEITARYSTIEHYQGGATDDTNNITYTSTVASGDVRVPESEASEALIMYTNSDGNTNGIINGAWKNLAASAITNATMIGTASSSIKLQGNDEVTEGDSNTSSDRPENYLLIAKTDIFDRVYFRTSNTISNATAHNLEMTAWYATASGWKELEIIDNTKGLNTSGSVTFKKPSDWSKTTADLINGTNTDWDGPVSSNNAADNDDPITEWDFSAYGLLIGFNAITSSPAGVSVTGIWPYSNSHSQLIKVVDPHHVSLNDIAIAQSISFSRNGKFQTIKDRFGKSEIRKMGVNGGTVNFGSVDLGDTDSQGNRKKIKQYQQNATPVFLDVTHKSGEKTRFFGVVTQMTEDHPPGSQFPKYGVQMQVSHIIELSSTGTLLSDKISIGGNIDDSRQFFVSS